MRKRVLSMLLVLVMVLAMLPVSLVMAEEAATEETVVTLDFNAAFATGKAVTKFTEAADGWAWYAEGSANATPMFYNSSSWDYTALRIKPTDANVTDLVGTIAFTAPTAGKYKMELTYAPGAIGNFTAVNVGGVDEVYYGYGAWGTEVATLTNSEVVLNEGSNLISLGRVLTSGEILVKQITFTLIEEVEPTQVAIDFTAEQAKGKGVTLYTTADDGWAYDAANSVGVGSAQFYQNDAWDYKALRLNKASDATSATAAISILAPVSGTYRLDLTYARGNSCANVDVSFGGQSVSYQAWANWGTEPVTATVHNVKLEKGVNTLTATSPAAMILFKDITLTLVEQDGLLGLDFDLYARSGKALANATLEDNGWALNADETTANVDFYQFMGNATGAAWGYKVLRAQGAGTTMAVDYTVPATGSYDVIITYARGNNCANVDVNVGDKTETFFAYATWGAEEQSYTINSVLLEEGTNTITFTPSAGMALIKEVKFVPVETSIVIDFDVEFNKGKHDNIDTNVAPFTIEEDGWCYNTEDSHDVTPGWYRYVDTNHEDDNGDSTWAYRVLRLQQTASGGLGVVDFPVAIPGTYTLTLEYAVGNNGNQTEVYVGGTTTAFHAWAQYGTPYKTAITEGVELTAGVNSIEFTTLTAASHIFVKKITLTLVEASGEVVVPECEHESTTSEYLNNNDGTHTVDVTCDDCYEIISSTSEECYDYEDGKCICGATVEVACDHTNTTESVVDNGDKTHTITVTCECGEVVSEETAQCADEDKDTACDACGATLVTITKFTMAGSNMTLGNELVVNVMFMKNKITGEGNTIEITHGDAVTTIAQADWESYNAAMYVARIPVAAKEMADDLTVTVKNADGYEIATAYTTSVREYAGKVLAGALTTYSQEMKNLAVDMLNYGAAAQTNFSYNTEDMANNALTEEQAGWATADVACTNNQVKGTKCMGSNLSLESKILLNIIFQLTETAAADKYAMVTYTDYTGKAVEYRVDAFNRFNASMQGVVVDEIVLADAFQLVTVTVYNADGSVYGTGSDSVESYAARTSNDLNAAIMKFASSAKTYLSK